MEASGGDGSRTGARGISRAVVMRRRLVAVALLAALALGLWLLLASPEDGEDAASPRTPADEGASTRIAATVENLSTEELADQVLLVGFEGAEASDELLDELRDRQLGGLLIAGENWAGVEAGGELTRALLAAGRDGERIPPLLATSQEGGAYRALADLPPEQTELELGDSGSPAAAEEWSRTAGAALRDEEILVNLSPVADVATLDSPVADRAFSDDPALAAEMTAAAIAGCEAARIACAPLHFPGLGAASDDTARGPATVGLDPAGLAERDLVPFEAAFAAGAPAVVVSLAAYTAYDPVTPAALAEPVVGGLLREELAFEGVAISDDLASGAIRAGRRVPDAAVAALASGIDLVQISAPDELDGVRNEILAAVEEGRLPEERLAEAAARVIALKRELGAIGGG